MRKVLENAKEARRNCRGSAKELWRKYPKIVVKVSRRCPECIIVEVFKKCTESVQKLLRLVPGRFRFIDQNINIRYTLDTIKMQHRWY